MAWVAVTEEDVRDRLSAAELAAFSSASLGAGQGNPVTAAIATTVDEARGYLAARFGDTMPATATVPPELVAAVVARIRFRAITRLPLQDEAILGERRREHDEALSILRDVAAGTFVVTQPEAATPAARFGSGTRRFAIA